MRWLLVNRLSMCKRRDPQPVAGNLHPFATRPRFNLRLFGPKRLSS